MGPYLTVAHHPSLPALLFNSSAHNHILDLMMSQFDVPTIVADANESSRRNMVHNVVHLA